MPIDAIIHNFAPIWYNEDKNLRRSDSYEY